MSAYLRRWGDASDSCALSEDIVLTKGLTVVGRRQLAGASKQVSRRQLVFRCNPEKGHFAVSCGGGAGTSYVIRTPELLEVPLEGEGEIDLKPGDRVTLNLDLGVCELVAGTGVPALSSTEKERLARLETQEMASGCEKGGDALRDMLGLDSDGDDEPPGGGGVPRPSNASSMMRRSTAPMSEPSPGKRPGDEASPETKRPALEMCSPTLIDLEISRQRHCPQCTFINPRNASTCEMCEGSLVCAPTLLASPDLTVPQEGGDGVRVVKEEDIGDGSDTEVSEATVVDSIGEMVPATVDLDDTGRGLRSPSAPTPTLAFPLLGKVEVAAECSLEFLSHEGKVRLVLCDEDARVIDDYSMRLKEHRKKKRAVALQGDVSSVRSTHGVLCTAIACTASQAKALARLASPHDVLIGVEPYRVVTLVPPSELHAQGVRHVICIGEPADNPRTAYRHIFNTFAKVAGLPLRVPEADAVEAPAKTLPSLPRYNNLGKAVIVPTHFTVALTSIITSVKRNGAAGDKRVFYADDRCIAVYDAYPKGKVHLLVMHLSCTVNKVADLQPAHLAMVQEMHTLGRHIARHLKATQFPSLDFQLGYHASPSLAPLHLHVMSTDYCVEAMKTRKHYLSFIPPFFVPADEVEGALAKGSAVSLPPSRLAAIESRDPLPCRWCAKVFSTIPNLKKHLEGCAANPNNA